MFRLPLLVAIALLTAFGAGIGSSVMMLNASSGFGAIRIGPWAAFPRAQTTEADPYAQSHRARAGRLLFGSAEGLMFQADEDDEGRRLSPLCTYRVSGQTPPARFWTLFAADDENEPLGAAEGLPAALNAWNVLRETDGTFVVTLSAAAQPGNWIAIRPDRRFRIVLALIDTPTAGSSGLLDIAMPKIERVGCA